MYRALGGKLENTVTSNLYALICQEHVKLNVKICEAKKLNIPLIRRDWIDHLIIHVRSSERLIMNRKNWYPLKIIILLKMIRKKK